MVRLTGNQQLGLLCPVSSLGCQTSGLGVAWTCISQGREGPVVGCGHYLHPLHNFVHLSLQMMLIPFAWIPGSHHGRKPHAVPSTMLVFLPGECTTLSSPPGTWGKVPGHQVSKCVGSSLPPLHQLEMTPPHSRLPKGRAPGVGGHSNSSSPSPPSAHDQSDSSHNVLSVCEVRRCTW